MSVKKERVKLSAKGFSAIKNHKKIAAVAMLIPAACLWGKISGGGDVHVPDIKPPAVDLPQWPAAKAPEAADAGPQFDKKAGEQNRKHDHLVKCSAKVSAAGGNLAINSTLEGGAYAGDWLQYTVESSNGKITGWSATPDFTVKNAGHIADGSNLRVTADYNYPFGNKTHHIGCDS